MSFANRQGSKQEDPTHMKIDQYNQSIWDSFPHLRKPEGNRMWKFRTFQRKPNSGNPARDESAVTRGAEYASCVDRIEEHFTGLAVYYTTLTSEKEKYYHAKASAARILQICKEFEEGLVSCEEANGGSAQNAQEKGEAQQARTANHQRVIDVGGTQLVFELYCWQCHFQCC